MKMFEFFNDESRWNQGSMSQDSNGDICRTTDAVSCCLVGAAFKCYPDSGVGALSKIMKHLKTASMGDVFDWNDTHTFSEVRALCQTLDI